MHEHGDEGPAGAGPGPVDAALVLDGAHPHGYLLVGAGVTPADDTAAWRTGPELLPGTTLRLHPRTVCSQGHGGSGTVVLLGHPVDVAAGLTDGDRIATRLASAWDLGGADALVREAAALGGRWTLLAATGAEVPHTDSATLLVVPDTHATQPVFYALVHGRFALGSTPALVARTLGLEVDHSALTLLEELRSRRGGAVTYLPGRRTAYLGLDPLLPNCLLRVRLGPRPSVQHERFWPWREREETTDLERVYRAFRDRFAAHAELLVGLGSPAVSLTAGHDSRVTAALAGPALRAADGFAFTYVNPRDARNGRAPMADVTGASAVAAQLGLPHRVLRWRQPPPGGTFDVLHRRTYDPLLPSRGAAHAMWVDLPRGEGLVQLQSNGGETGTTFLRHRSAEPLSPLRLARMMMNASEGLEDLAEAMYGGYLDYAQLTPQRLRGYDHHDVFYWEQRMGRWGWQKFTDGDLGHRILLPFNDRVLLETMLSLPYPQREAKVLFERVLMERPAGRLPARRDARPAAGGRTASALGALSGRVGRGVPGPVGSLARRVGERLENAGRRRVRADVSDRLTWARGYAVLTTSSPSVPSSWERVELPGGVARLHVHPSLPHALGGDDQRGVLVLGEPVDIGAGLLGAPEVARALAEELMPRGRTREAALAAAEERAATLAGSWLVLLTTPARTVAITDPLVSLGLHLLPGGSGLVSHPGLAGGSVTELGVAAGTGSGGVAGTGSGGVAGTGSGGVAGTGSAPGSPWAGSTGCTCLGPDDLAVAPGPLGIVPWRVASLAALVDVPGAGMRTADLGWTRLSRLARHVDLLRGLGPVWLGLTGGSASGELLGQFAAVDGSVSALTWWDRLAGDEAAAQVFAASARAADAGVPHRVVGLREDLNGSTGEPGRSRRVAADSALSRTFHSAAGQAPPLPVGDALEQVVPEDGVLWLAARPRPRRPLGAPASPACCGPIVVDLAQGVRPVALPFSDRLLELLPR